MRTTLIGLLLLAACSCPAQEVISEFAYFDYNQSELTPSTKQTLDSIVAIAGIQNISEIELSGHTDSDGDAAANELLSANRVNAVQSYLIAKGIKETVFVTAHFGESKPAYTNSTEQGMQKNRRVEVSITYTAPQKEPVVPAPVAPVTPAVSQPTSTKSCFPVVGTTEVFKESAKKEIDITAAKGTHFVFPKDCFVDVNGKAVTGEVTIEIVEVYTKDEMIMHNLSTMSYKRMLESGGMTYVHVENKDGAVRLLSYMPYTVEFPTTNKITGMQLFYGDTTSGGLNWIAKGSAMKGGDWDYVAQQTLDKYVFTSSKLGWINCDHFLQDYTVSDLFVQSNDTAGVSFCVVFKDFNSVMTRDMNAEDITFRNVPVGQQATIIAFKKTQTGALYASREVTLENNMRVDVVMVQLSEMEFQDKIAGLK